MLGGCGTSLGVLPSWGREEICWGMLAPTMVGLGVLWMCWEAAGAPRDGGSLPVSPAYGVPHIWGPLHCLLSL